MNNNQPTYNPQQNQNQSIDNLYQGVENDTVEQSGSAFQAQMRGNEGAPINKNGNQMGAGQQQPSNTTGNPLGLPQGVTVENRGSNHDAGFVDSGNPFQQSPQQTPSQNFSGGDEPTNLNRHQQQPVQPQGNQQVQNQSPNSESEEIQRLYDELEEAKQYKQFGQMVEQDPQLMQTINNHVFGDQKQNGQVSQGQEQEQNKLTPPEFPEDPYDTDAMREYNQKMIDYQEKVTDQKARSIADERIGEFQQQLSQQEQQREMQNYLQSEKQRIASEYGADDLSGFEEWANNPQNLDMETLYQLYQIQNGNPVQPAQNRQPNPVQQQRFPQGQQAQQQAFNQQPQQQFNQPQPQQSQGRFREHNVQGGQMPFPQQAPAQPDYLQAHQMNQMQANQGYPTPMANIPSYGSQQGGNNDIISMMKSGAAQSDPMGQMF